jgi:pimeloyl-ACP methyl ester carboxylesterase
MDGSDGSNARATRESANSPAAYDQGRSGGFGAGRRADYIGRRCTSTLPGPWAGPRMHVNEGTVEIGGVPMHYVEWGERTRRHVLLVHGWDGTAHYWDLVAPALADRYHLVAITLRGRGRSDPDSTERYRFGEYGHDIREVTRHLGLERLSFVGASLGGMIALPYVAEHEAQVDRLVLVDIGAQLGGDRPSSYYAGMLAAPAEFPSTRAIEEWLRQWSLYAKIPADGMAIVVREHFVQAPNGRFTWRFGERLRELQRRQSRETLFPSQWDVLGKIRCPVLIVRGGRSESLLPDVAERTRAGLADALLVEIPDCSHFPFLERPRELTLLLSGFLA